MYQVGHYGVALLAYAPIGAVTAGAGYEQAAIVGGLVCLGLSTLPDVDQQLPGIDHRGPTHSVVFALLVGLSVAAVTAVLIASSSLADGRLVAFGFVVGTVAILSHLLGDILTPMGIRPFWPVLTTHYTINVTKAANPIANYVLFVLGVGAVLVAVAAVTVVG